MACVGNRQARRSAGLFRSRDRDRTGFAAGSSARAAPARGKAPIDRASSRRARRRWRKLHLAIDADSHEIVAVELTTDDVGDVTVVPDLLDQIDGSVASMTADGGYETEVAYDEVSRRHPDADVIIPPRSTAVASERGTTRRDQHLRTIEKHGRIG